MPERPAVCGIDLGGTKIETKLYDANLESLAVCQAATPQTGYADLLDAIEEQIDWAMTQADVPIGIGLPGLIDPRTGLALTANIPANGKPLAQDISDRIGQPIAIENDCKCFALSEANGGAAAGHRMMFGLILGTGLGGGVCVNGHLATGPNRIAGEVGHFALPATIIEQHNLPLILCGCGRMGCFETYLSGRGLSRLDELLNAKARPAPELLAAGADEVFDIWYALLGEMLHTLQLTLDPDCIVLGGGLSNLPNIEARSENALAAAALSGLTPPVIRIARFGANSGGRGAALCALQTHKETNDVA